MRDLHQLPKLSDSISYLYVERCIIEQKALAVEKIDKYGRTMIPAANLTVLMLGPGTSITHAAVKSLSENGCGIVWVGEDATRFYAHGNGETRRAYHLLHQARLASNPQTRLAVCKRMYRKRFDEELDPELSIEQLRGKEGARVRTTYTQQSIIHGVQWEGRNYNRNEWGDSDPINRALSTANALLYGVCHAAIVSGGYSPALGFIHTGKQRSFVFDIADLYKVEITIPLAFRVVGEGNGNIYARTRKACRDAFKENRLLKRILPDIAEILDLAESTLEAGSVTDVDAARPEPLWTPPGEDTCSEDEVLLRLVAPPSETVSVKPPRNNNNKAEICQIEQATTPILETIPHEKSKEDKAKALQTRLARAEAGLAGKWNVEKIKPHTWRVITNSGPPGYIVLQIDNYIVCDCPDYDRNELDACKHTMAVQIVEARDET